MFHSNFALSELPRKIQKPYVRLAQRTPYGFVTWNHGVHADAMNGTEFASLMERRGREVLIAASRGLPAALRHRRDSTYITHRSLSQTNCH